MNPVTLTRSAAQGATVQHPTGVVALATTLLVWVVEQAGLGLPAAVAAAFVGLAAAAVSYLTPRVAEDLGIARPAGLTGLAVTVLVWIGEIAGLNLTPEIAASIVGLAVIVVSALRPRFPRVAAADLDGAGPDDGSH